MESLYDTWLSREDSYYEEKFKESIIENLCQFHGGTADGRKAKGKFFNAGYEVFIYAFFLGLYYGERKPLTHIATDDGIDQLKMVIYLVKKGVFIPQMPSKL